MNTARLKAYYSTLKPERTYANVITTIAGYLFASAWHINWTTFIAAIIGTSLIVASACAANNYTDRDIDSRMPRTKKRALVANVVPTRNVAIIAVIFGIAGVMIMATFVNWLTVLLGVIGYIDYVILYSWSKRTTPYSTLIGTISGAVPIVAGYTAATNRFDLPALLLGIIMVAWQMAHFYSIAIYRHADYAAAKLPIWSVAKGDTNTRNWIFFYVVLFIICSALLAAAGPAGIVYLVVMLAMGVAWLVVGLRNLKGLTTTLWAKKMFIQSLWIMLGMSAMISVATVAV